MWRSHVNLLFDNLQCTTYLQFGYLVIWIGAKAIVSKKRGKGTLIYNLTIYNVLLIYYLVI